MIVLAVGLALVCFLLVLLLLDEVDLTEDLDPGFEVLFDEAVDFDLVVGFFVAVVFVEGFEAAAEFAGVVD